MLASKKHRGKSECIYGCCTTLPKGKKGRRILKRRERQEWKNAAA